MKSVWMANPPPPSSAGKPERVEPLGRGVREPVVRLGRLVPIASVGRPVVTAALQGWLAPMEDGVEGWR